MPTDNGPDSDDAEHMRDRADGLLFNIEEWAAIERDLGRDASREDLIRWKADREARGIPTGWPRSAT